MTTESPTPEVKEFEAKSAVAIFGAPISWVALFGALIGALSIVPLLMYPFGGGFMSAGMGVFGPITGILLGPWAGAVAGTIGGFIGMMISPAAYPLGFVDVVLSGVLLPFSWGLLVPKHRKLCLVLFPIHAFVYWLFPYHWPANAAGLTEANEPQWILGINWTWLSALVFIFLAPTLWRWMQSESRGKYLVGLVINCWMAAALWAMPWVYPYSYLVRYPYEVAILGFVTSWVNTLLPVTAISSIIGYFLIRAVLKGSLRKVPGSWVDEFDFKYEV
jgi:hypothetical protein